MEFSPQTSPRFLAFRDKLADGTSTLIVLQIATLIARFASTLILSRIFTPDVYGAVAIVTSVFFVLNMASDMGLNTYITRHPTGTPDVLRTLWTARIVRNVFLALVLIIGGPTFAKLYNAPHLATAIQVLAASLALEAATSMSFITGIREQRVIRISILEFIIAVATIIFTIIAAIQLKSYWAVIYGMLFGAALRVVFSYSSIPCVSMRLHWSWDELKLYWQYLRIVIPASIIAIVLTQLDRFYLANFFPLDELGKFTLAATLTAAGAQLVSQYRQRVFFPKLAGQIRDDLAKSKEVYYALRRRFTLVMAFLLGGLIGSAEFVIRLLYNDNYLGAEYYLALTAILPLATLITQPAESALVTIGKYSVALTGKIIRLGWVVVGGLGAFYLFSPRAVIVALSLTELAALPYMLWRLRQAGFFKAQEELYIVAAAFLGIAIGLLGNFGIESLVSIGFLPRF